MNQPIEQRFTAIENRLSKLEQFEREAAHKATIAWGLAVGLEDDVRQIKVDVQQVKIEIQHLREEMGNKLDMILKLLQPRHE